MSYDPNFADALDVPGPNLATEPPPTFACICGKAGTGKTFWAKELCAVDSRCMLVATTGIAAINGEGTTINSLLGYFDTNDLRQQYEGGWAETKLARLYKAGLRRIFLDEVSMLDANQLTILTRLVKDLNTRLEANGDIDTANGDTGLGLTLIGDFGQLPPVKADYAFESPAWREYAAATTILEDIWRQDDLAFIEALGAIRRGEGLAALRYFEPRIVADQDNTFDGTTIMAKNAAVDRHNSLRLDEVRGEPFSIQSTSWGEQRQEWKNIPLTLNLKIGALVMILANRKVESVAGGPPDPRRPLIYANGDLGHVVGQYPVTFHTQDGGQQVVSAVQVVLKRTGQPVDVFTVTRQNTIALEPGRRKALRSEGREHLVTEDGRYEVTGEITYMPIRLAYASTVHKTQGLTLDVVQVNIRDPFFMKPGMLYVALSRCRTADGLRLVGTPQQFAARCQVSTKIREWL